MKKSPENRALSCAGAGEGMRTPHALASASPRAENQQLGISLEIAARIFYAPSRVLRVVGTTYLSGTSHKTHPMALVDGELDPSGGTEFD
jgi:hypothetical protein